ncbi:hypothetical protein GCM10008995_14960 [Halobellus salinus]|uniref:Putative sensor domain-containing protein n=2 Tax=Halobellus salinus TaxID=931585 RepID=A0A830EAG8_9EURY|nr:sensor domain-containing protein [Halobellus salinus]GGJ06085.1 hypothetical protein GCM10008995_14960 [Halobellus salinus]SMP23995.1 Putative sensor [Halobellus salinus]
MTDKDALTRLAVGQLDPNIYSSAFASRMWMRRLADTSTTGVARSFLTVPFRPQTYLNLLYLLLAFPLGVAYFVVFSVGVSTGIGLLIVIVGGPILALSAGVALGIGSVERRVTALLLGVELGGRPSVSGETRRERVWNLGTDLRTWLALLYLPGKFVVGTVALVVFFQALVTGGAFLFVPFYYEDPSLYVGLVRDRPIEIHPVLHFGWNRLLVTLEPVITIGHREVTTLSEALAIAGFGAVVSLVGLNLLNVLARVNVWLARVCLNGAYDPVAALRS